MGLIVFNVEKQSAIMRQWFDKYDRNVQSITNGGDQTHINYEIQSWGKITWLDYRFQAIWPWEMAWKYPFLYQKETWGSAAQLACIEAALYQNHFLHFAGSWHESAMWKSACPFADNESNGKAGAYKEYLKVPVTGNPVGFVKP